MPCSKRSGRHDRFTVDPMTNRATHAPFYDPRVTKNNPRCVRLKQAPLIHHYRICIMNQR